MAEDLFRVFTSSPFHQKRCRNDIESSVYNYSQEPKETTTDYANCIQPCSSKQRNSRKQRNFVLRILFYLDKKLKKKTKLIRRQGRKKKSIFSRHEKISFRKENQGLKCKSNHSDARWPINSSQKLFICSYPIRPKKMEEFKISNKGQAKAISFKRAWEKVGKGAYSEVFRVVDKESGNVFAIKKLAKSTVLNQKLTRQVDDEIAILKTVGQHPFILKFVDAWQSKGFLYQVLPYMKNGDLFTLWRKEKQFPLKCVAVSALEIASALDFMHACHIIYRDLKMENILLEDKGHIALTDFGLSKDLTECCKTFTICGTLKYMAPEIAVGCGYSFQCDWWSFGILIVAMATGKFPYHSMSDHGEMLNHIKQKTAYVSQITQDPAIKEVMHRVLQYHYDRRVANLADFLTLKLVENIPRNVVNSEVRKSFDLDKLKLKVHDMLAYKHPDSIYSKLTIETLEQEVSGLRKMKVVCYRSLIQLRLVRQLHSAYIINPALRAEEYENQACYLTKTIKKDGLPDCIYENKLPSEEKLRMIEAIKTVIIETNYFHRDEELWLNKRWKDARKQRMINDDKSEMALQVLFNMFRILWTSKHARYAGFQEKNFSYRVDLSAPWERFNEKLQVNGKIGHLICGKKLLPLFASTEEIESSRNVELTWEDVISPFFDMKQYPTIFQANRGFYDNAPFPCPQNLVLLNSWRWETRMKIGQACFYSFAHALTYALANGETMGEDLKQPVPIQSLVFDGSSFYFICYQLNTLNFDDNNSSIKNFVWVQPDDFLYEKVHDKPSQSEDFIDYTAKRVSLVDYDRKRLTETFEDERTKRVYIEKFQPPSVDRFIDFMYFPYQT